MLKSIDKVLSSEMKLYRVKQGREAHEVIELRKMLRAGWRAALPPNAAN